MLIFNKLVDTISTLFHTSTLPISAGLKNTGVPGDGRQSAFRAMYRNRRCDISTYRCEFLPPSMENWDFCVLHAAVDGVFIANVSRRTEAVVQLQTSGSTKLVWEAKSVKYQSIFSGIRYMSPEHRQLITYHWIFSGFRMKDNFKMKRKKIEIARKIPRKHFFFSCLGWVEVTTKHHLANFWCPTISHHLSPPQKRKIEFLPAPRTAVIGENRMGH